jgi:hypothetical protein
MLYKVIEVDHEESENLVICQRKLAHSRKRRTTELKEG